MTYLRLAEMFAIVRAVRVANIIQRSLQAGRVRLHERNAQVEHRARVGLPYILEAARDLRPALVNVKWVVRSGPAQCESEETEEEQTCCDHPGCELNGSMVWEGWGVASESNLGGGKADSGEGDVGVPAVICGCRDAEMLDGRGCGPGRWCPATTNDRKGVFDGSWWMHMIAQTVRFDSWRSFR